MKITIQDARKIIPTFAAFRCQHLQEEAVVAGVLPQDLVGLVPVWDTPAFGTERVIAADQPPVLTIQHTSFDGAWACYALADVVMVHWRSSGGSTAMYDAEEGTLTVRAAPTGLYALSVFDLFFRLIDRPDLLATEPEEGETLDGICTALHAHAADQAAASWERVAARRATREVSR